MTIREREQEITRSWSHNADAWTAAVRDRRIESRRLVTDDAIVDAGLSCGGSRVLDVGCGEGWLARRLAEAGRDVVGFDGSERLIERARELGGASFVVASYDAFAADPGSTGGRFDVIVANFSLLGEEIAELLGALRRVVADDGRLVIQTVHPDAVDSTTDGWQEERFEPLAPLPFAPMPWYFRTLESWRRALSATGWRVTKVREPVHPASSAVASLILIAEPAS